MKLKRIIAVPLALIMLFILSGCNNQIEPEAVGLRYNTGPIEGKSFDSVLEPGDVAFTMNDEVAQLPTSQRSFIIRKDDDDNKNNDPDVKGFITVPSRDGTLIDFEVSTAFKLNTRTDDIPDFPGGTARKFYEDLCRHYDCALDGGESPAGWRQLLREKFLPQLESAFKDEARKNDGDDIVNNADGTLTALQDKVGETFLRYLDKQAGSKFFCGPSFDRKKTKVCPPVELLIISADYNNPDVRKSREAKKVAIDQSAAQSELEKALNDPQYLRYLEIQAMEKCTQSAKATCIFSTGQAPVTVPAR